MQALLGPQGNPAFPASQEHRDCRVEKASQEQLSLARPARTVSPEETVTMELLVKEEILASMVSSAYKHRCKSDVRFLSKLYILQDKRVCQEGAWTNRVLLASRAILGLLVITAFLASTEETDFQA